MKSRVGKALLRVEIKEYGDLCLKLDHSDMAGSYIYLTLNKENIGELLKHKSTEISYIKGKRVEKTR